MTTIRVKPILESLSYIKKNGASVARFGDGEIDLIMGSSIPYQDYSEELARRLKKILQTPSSPQFLVCLPDVFEKMERYNANARVFWEKHFERYGDFYEQECRSDWYGSTFLSRPYIDLVDKSQSVIYFAAIKQLWQDRDILIVEGETTRSGMGNDLFSNARSVSRIVCPSRNAYEHYDEILEKVNQEAQGRLVLAMLGPTAKLLAVDLMVLGHQAIDLGHIDSEYEWYQMKAQHKVKLDHKHTAEFNYDEGISEQTDDLYQSQVLARIGTPDSAPSQPALFEVTEESKGLISIIVPVYNVESYLARCLDSLLKQTYSHFEVLLINDGSTDGSLRIAMDYASKDSRIKLFHQKNSGPSAARNYGLDLAQGDYITFIDSDDFVETTYLENMHTALVSTGSDISSVNFTSYNEERQSYMFYQTASNYFEKVYSVQEWLDQEGNMKHNFHLVFTFSPMKLFKKKLFEHVRYPVGRLREDDATMYKLYLQANQIAFRNEGTYFYSQRPDGLSRKTMQADVASMISNAEERLALLLALGYDPSSHLQSYIARLEKCQQDALRAGYMQDYRDISLKLALYKNHKKRD